MSIEVFVATVFYKILSGWNIHMSELFIYR